MRNIAICSRQLSPAVLSQGFVETIELEGILVHCGLLHTLEPAFNPNSSADRAKVLVKKRAFSCNYRDKALILQVATSGANAAFYVVGSDFVGEVVATGAEVTQFQVGDRVIGNCCYPESGVAGVAPGVPTNHASKEYQVFHAAKLIKVPPEMPDAIAASFSIGGQTSYSMIRKLDLKGGETVLVTAARSNTSLFVISALQRYDVTVYATTTSRQFEAELKQLGVKDVILVDPTSDTFASHEAIAAVVAKTGGFNCIIDPFFDLHLGKVVDVMAFDARYVTCGFYNQYSNLTGKPFHYRGQSMGAILNEAMLKNLHLIGNCLGQTEDLHQAVQDYAVGKLKVIVDSVFTDRQVSAFFDRTYNATDRLGKVVYQYC